MFVRQYALDQRDRRARPHRQSKRVAFAESETPSRNFGSVSADDSIPAAVPRHSASKKNGGPNAPSSTSTQVRYTQLWLTDVRLIKKQAAL